VKRVISPALILRSGDVINYTFEKAKQLDTDCLSFDGVPDIIASIFFVLTRYEEYLPSQRDEYSRYKYSSSVLAKYDWVEKAVCDRWAKAVINYIDSDLYIDFTLKNSLTSAKPGIIPTFDIDNVYAYQYKTGKRKLLAVTKDLLLMRFNRLKERRQVNSGSSDPYDTYDKIRSTIKEHCSTKLFWLVESRGEKDRNLDINEPHHKELVHEFGGLCDVYLHPSFGSFGDAAKIRSEREKLEVISGKNIDSTRQHFLRFKLPDTYHDLISAGIDHEYSMGFAERAGFRCGTARSHFWFDLSKNELTNLKIHPFAYMDGTLNEYMNIGVEKSKDLISKLYREVKEYGGDFIFIWHNETIGDHGIWQGWSSVFDHTLQLDKNG
jgi:hypothetical protein